MFEYSKEATHTHYYFDKENKMLLYQPAKSWSRNGQGDAIGRNRKGYFIYKDHELVEGVLSCWEKVETKKGYYYQGYRYPTKDFPTGLSRDHLLNTVLILKEAEYSNEYIKDFVTHLRWKISDFANFTPDLWVWCRVAYGSKFHTFLYYLMAIPMLFFTWLWNKILYSWYGIEEEKHQDDFYMIPEEEKPKWVFKVRPLLYPIYALEKQAWQLHYMKNSLANKICKKLTLMMCPKHNYVIKMLCGDYDSFKEEDVIGFKPMKGGRWTGILDPLLNDRNMHIIEDPKIIEYNVLDRDTLLKLYLKHKNLTKH
jgi:hypothetical protein